MFSKTDHMYLPQYRALNECHQPETTFRTILNVLTNIMWGFFKAQMDIVVYYKIFSTNIKVRLNRSPPFDFFCRGVWEKSLVSQTGHRQGLNP